MMRSTPARGEYAVLFLLSASALVFEINLTRIFSVTQFYHFAFMIVSLALLGSGASGAFLAVFPAASSAGPRSGLGWAAVGCSVSILGGYLLVNWLPFDSFAIAWEPEQIFILLLHYTALALPFFCAGLAASLLLQAYLRRRGAVYAVNLGGSAAGCALALALPAAAGGEGMVLVSSGLAALAGLACAPERGRPPKILGRARALAAAGLLLFALFALAAQGALGKPLRLLELRLSHYKAISYALQYPGARVASTRWNSFSRVDRVASEGIRSYPGLSYLYMQPLPGQDAIFIDGDDLSPALRAGASAEFAAYMPAAAAYLLRPGAQVLILEPRGGLDIFVAQASGAAEVTAVEMNPLAAELASEAYRLPGVSAVIDTPRGYLRRTGRQFGVIVLAQASGYHAVRSGAYSLAEDYQHTVEAYAEALLRLEPGGLLATTHWLQSPPSEELRSYATAVAAVERLRGDPRAQIAAFRGYNTLTLLVRRSPFTAAELRALRQFAASRAYDLVIAPDIDPGETNRYNILPEDIYYQSFAALLAAQPRENFFRAYPYEVSPPTDDRPFFGHFFKWSQAGQVLAALGRTWQPFGGAGYFVILVLLLFAVLAAALLILLPVFLRRRGPRAAPEQDGRARAGLALPAYFGLVGFAYLLVEIPLIQQFILFLGHPAYAMTAVLFTLLLFSGLGSLFSERAPLRPALAALALLVLLYPAALPLVFERAMGLPLALRLATAAAVLAPAGFLMGIPFPAGLRWFLGEEERSPRLPWVWSINGAASVVAAVLAALLALSFGLAWVLRIGALCYAAAWVTAAAFARPRAAGSPPR